MSGWTDLTSELTSAFRDVTDRVFLIIASEADPARYVQFAGRVDRLDAEAPSVDVVANADVAVLESAGWAAPTAAQPNWSSSVRIPALTTEYEALAVRCVAALRDAYGIASPADLGYRAWREAEILPPDVEWSEERIAQSDQGESSLRIAALSSLAAS